VLRINALLATTEPGSSAFLFEFFKNILHGCFLLIEVCYLLNSCLYMI